LVISWFISFVGVIAVVVELESGFGSPAARHAQAWQKASPTRILRTVRQKIDFSFIVTFTSCRVDRKRGNTVLDVA